MKVLLVSPLPPPEGGIATWTVRYQQYCSQNDIPLIVVNNALNGVRGSQINAKRNAIDEIFRSFRIFRDLIFRLHKGKPDIIHLNTSCSKFGIFRDCVCASLGRLFSVPVVLQCHCNIQDQVHGRLAVGAFKYLVSITEKVLVLNRFSEEYAKRYAAERVEVVPNFTEAQNLYERETVSETIRQAVFVGHVRREKGVMEIVEAAKHFPEIHFILVGPVHQDIAEMPCGSNVEFMGSQPHEKVLQILRNADIFLFPSYTEGFANALLEAMSSGLPVIATDVGANAEMLENEGGIIIPTADENALSDAIRRLMKDASARRKMSAKNVERVRKNYLIGAVLKKITRIYEEVITCR